MSIRGIRGGFIDHEFHSAVEPQPKESHRRDAENEEEETRKSNPTRLPMARSAGFQPASDDVYIV